MAVQSPPGVAPVNKIRKSRFRGATKSYVWRHRGKKRVLFQFSSSIQHVVVIYMENRTPDNLFAGYFSTYVPGRFPEITYGTALDLVNPAASPVLGAISLSDGFDPNHRHKAFSNEAGGTPPPNDGLGLVGTCSSTTIYSYINASEVANYWS
jgi:hypothetical protein